MNRGSAASLRSWVDVTEREYADALRKGEIANDGIRQSSRFVDQLN